MKAFIFFVISSVLLGSSSCSKPELPLANSHARTSAQVAAALAYAAFAVADEADDSGPQASQVATQQATPSISDAEAQQLVARPRAAKTPRVQCLVVGEIWCGPCRRLKHELVQQLTNEVARRGENPWKVGPEADAHFRFVTMDQFNRGQRTEVVFLQLPRIFWQVDGHRSETSERDPIQLANEFHRRLDRLKGESP